MIKEQAERARQLVESQLLDSDFSWMRSARESGARNPRMARTSCYYDFTRGVVGSQKGAPLWVEGRGRWCHVLAGSSKVASLKLYPGSYIVLRVPFRKTGSAGTYANSWSVSAMVRFEHLGKLPVLSTGGWDQYSAMNDGDDQAQIVMNGDGILGAHNIFGSSDGGGGGGGVTSPAGARVEAREWCAISVCVDAVAGVLRTYIHGRECCTIRSPKICRDGQHSLKGRVALFFGPQQRPGEIHLRQLTVHGHTLSAAQVSSEHEMLHAMLLDDALGAAPECLRATLHRQHAEEPFVDTRSIRACMRDIMASVHGKCSEVWRALLGPAAAEAACDPQTLELFASHDLAVAARWCWAPADGGASAIDEADAPCGETLLHCAAHAGCAPLVEALLSHGASPLVRGESSGCTPLHAAAARGHTAICALLLEAGASVSPVSLGAKRSALDLACAHGHSETALLLVKAGGADPYLCAPGGECAASLLRRRASPADLALLGSLDALCSAKATADRALDGGRAAAPQPAEGEGKGGSGSDEWWLLWRHLNGAEESEDEEGDVDERDDEEFEDEDEDEE